MSNIDKQALREAAEKANPEQYGYYLIDAFTDLATPATVLALLDELEAADALNKHLELAIRKAEGCSEALRRETEAAERHIAELEAREVVLPSTQDVHPLGPQSAKIFCEFHRNIINRCADEIRKVGVNVIIKGE
ncbi:MULTISPECIES: ead/Ea22-like family protein [unclassified Leclercia]|uniref:ead/Ea22-like family protein n=1 Tax=unclassified Leclercia TaxID=2627398 RepID=UPI0025BE56FD|nr:MULTISPECIES: ead/Ea22-like family protein [unclassified Leclercia]